MPKNKISEYSTTNSSNTDIESINIDEGCPPSSINNAIRELMVHLKEFQTGSSGDPLTVAGGMFISGGGSANTLTVTGILTASGGTILSSTNTLSGGNILSGTNTISGSAIISGNINSSGTTNTFSGGNILSGTNTISGSAIISGNINSSGTTNTFSGTQVISGASTFSKPAKGTVTTDDDGSFDMNDTNNFLCTPTGAITLTFTNITAGQSGNIVLVNGSNHTVSAAAATKVGTGVLTALSATGTYWVSYFSPDGTNVYISATGALA